MNRERWVCGLVWALLLSLGSTTAAQERLPTVRVSGKTPCQVHPDSGAETADLWLIAREALEGSIRTDSATPHFLIQEWRRNLGPGFRLQWERRDTSTVATLHPFEHSMPNLDRGYIQTRGWSTWFYGPDADHLLSESFLRRHCFGRIEGSDANAGLSGLSFRPLPKTDRPDVTGVLWVDPVLRELRHVEYTWTDPPREAQAPGIGGRTEFVRLAAGGWIVQRWNIRMPRFGVGFWQGLDGYIDEGGEVLAVSAGKARRK